MVKAMKGKPAAAVKASRCLAVVTYATRHGGRISFPEIAALLGVNANACRDIAATICQAEGDDFNPETSFSAYLTSAASANLDEDEREVFSPTEAAAQLTFADTVLEIHRDCGLKRGLALSVAEGKYLGAALDLLELSLEESKREHSQAARARLRSLVGGDFVELAETFTQIATSTRVVENLTVLTRALPAPQSKGRRQLVQFDYLSSMGETSQVIAGVDALEQVEDGWLLHAFDWGAKTYAHYRVAGIANLIRLPETMATAKIPKDPRSGQEVSIYLQPSARWVAEELPVTSPLVNPDPTGTAGSKDASASRELLEAKLRVWREDWLQGILFDLADEVCATNPPDFLAKAGQVARRAQAAWETLPKI